MSEKVTRSEEEWKKMLTSEQYEVLRRRGTERPFTGEYWKTKDKGIYLCAACGQELFNSKAKFDSGTGWPSFQEPMGEGVVQARSDSRHGTQRVEIVCSRCGSHLGHVFDDGPGPTGQRFCVNSCALKLEKKKMDV